MSAATEWATAIDRWANVLRYHKPGQLVRRLAKQTMAPIRAKIPRFAGGVEVAVRRLPNQLPTWGPTCAFDAEDLRAGRLTFLNLGVRMPGNLDWDVRCWPDAPALWRFHLHYHDWLVLLADNAFAAGDFDILIQTIISWSDRYSEPKPADLATAWHPYCISRRIPAWCRLLRQLPLEEKAAARLQECLARQAQFLSRNFEYDLGGNHVWENARGLATAGCYFEGPIADRWRRHGLQELHRCIGEQVLPWGEHFERSPSYQDHLADGLADLAAWCEPMDGEAARELRMHSGRMQAFSAALRHPDGQPPLFGDTVERRVRPDSGAPVVSTGPKRSASWLGHYFLFEDECCRLTFDAGNMGPDELPAHSHADLLGFELSLHGRRAIVDAGVFCYAGESRSKYRRSASHNVLTVNDTELADVWSSFRMGRRGHVVDRAWGNVDGNIWVRATHNAYASLGLRVDRYWLLPIGGPIFSIHLVAGGIDGVPLRFCERVHWHPAVEWRRTEADSWQFEMGGATARWLAASNLTSSIETGRHSPDFYIEQDCLTIRMETESEPPCLIAWCVDPHSRTQQAQTALDGRWLVAWWKDDGAAREMVMPAM